MNESYVNIGAKAPIAYSFVASLGTLCRFGALLGLFVL